MMPGLSIEFVRVCPLLTFQKQFIYQRTYYNSNHLITPLCNLEERGQRFRFAVVCDTSMNVMYLPVVFPNLRYLPENAVGAHGSAPLPMGGDASGMHGNASCSNR